MQRSALIGPAKKLLPFQKPALVSYIPKFPPSTVLLALREYSTVPKRGPPQASPKAPRTPKAPRAPKAPRTPKAPKLIPKPARTKACTTPTLAAPHRFKPPRSASRPNDLFTTSRSPNTYATRLVSKTDPYELLLFANGIHCKHPIPGGLGVFVSPDAQFAASLIAPPGIAGYTHADAHLQAVTTALQLHDWHAEGFRSVVVACGVPFLGAAIDGSALVEAENAAQGIATRHPESLTRLLDAMHELEAQGLKVSFWGVRKNDNLAVRLSEIGMDPDVDDAEVALQRRRKRQRQVVGLVLVGGAAVVGVLVAVKLGY